jgi:phosphonate degradation associated HDIG domain protein
MSTPRTLEDIERLYAARGGLHYGEGVSQIEHALQCASLAEAAGASASLIAATLLHDIGHLIEHERETADFSVDDHHEASGAKALAGLFGEAVWRPVALHVAAKRYLCFTEPDYFARLSPASKASLKLQGGAYDAARAAGFERLPYWREARDLRRFDDTGKRDAPSPRAFADFLPLLGGLLSAT